MVHVCVVAGGARDERKYAKFAPFDISSGFFWAALNKRRTMWCSSCGEQREPFARIEIVSMEISRHGNALIDVDVTL